MQATKLQISPFTAYAVPTYLRLTRVGTTYTAYWSTNGTTWNQAGTFTDSLVVTGLAPYAWNYSTTPSQAPALTATFDWFHNLASGGTPVAATPTFTPASGTSFSSTLSVSIADTTAGAAIYYTTNGSTPTTGSQLYSGPFTISASTTVECDRYSQRVYAKRAGLGQLYLLASRQRSSGIGRIQCGQLEHARCGR